MTTTAPVISQEIAVKLESVKPPLVTMPEQLIADMGVFVEAVKLMVLRKRDATDAADALPESMMRAASVGQAIPEAVEAYAVARLSISKIEKVMIDALRTLSREVEDGDDEE